MSQHNDINLMMKIILLRVCVCVLELYLVENDVLPCSNVLIDHVMCVCGFIFQRNMWACVRMWMGLINIFEA